MSEEKKKISGCNNVTIVNGFPSMSKKEHDAIVKELENYGAFVVSKE